jgi:hypothetical protein
VIGGKYIVWAPDDQQGFPSGFGEDGKLFTEDDPIVLLPAGYTVVDMDTDPFTFDRSAQPSMELIEPEGLALDDFSDMSYAEAFDAMIELFRREYAFTELKGIDWDAKSAEFRPRFEEADANNDSLTYRRALRDFIWSIPDGHLSGPFIQEDFIKGTAGGVGMAIRDVEDGRTIVNFLTSDGPAERAGIELGAEILTWNGQPIGEYIDSIVPFSSPFSADHVRRLQQLRYGMRMPLGSEIEVTFKNPGDDTEQSAVLTAEDENESFRVSSFNIGRTGAELPVEFRLLDNGLGYVKLYSFSDNELLTVQLWERMMQTLNENGIPGLIIDMRQNGGGSGFLADQMPPTSSTSRWNWVKRVPTTNRWANSTSTKTVLIASTCPTNRCVTLGRSPSSPGQTVPARASSSRMIWRSRAAPALSPITRQPGWAAHRTSSRCRTSRCCKSRSGARSMWTATSLSRMWACRRRSACL